MSNLIEAQGSSFSDYKKIEDTEASIVNNHLGKTKGQITKLAGCVGEESVRLHINSIEYKNLPVEFKPHISITLSVSDNHNPVTIGSTHQLSPLYKSDYITFYFDDNSTAVINFIIGGHKVGSEKCNYTSITDYQLLHLANRKLTHIDVFNSKEKINVSFNFNGVPNRQYSTHEEGQYLLQIVAKRLMGIKLLLKNQ